MVAIKAPRSTFGACGPSVWWMVVCPNRTASDSPTTNSTPTKVAMNRQIMMMRSFLILRAARFVFMGGDYAFSDDGC